MKFEQLTHVALHVADVEASCRFYHSALLLENIPRPAFDFPGAWLRLGSEQELHLIGGRTQPVVSGNRGNHFALLVDDIDAWERHLNATQIPIRTKKVRPDGAIQIYVVDPDGHVIELCTPPGAARYESARAS